MNFSDALFLKVEALYGIKLNDEDERDAIKDAKAEDVTMSIFTSGPIIKLSLGWRLGM